MIERGYFFLEISENEVMDLGDLSLREWREIEDRAKVVLNAKQTTNEKVAFLAAFLNYYMQIKEFKAGFNDKMN